VGLADRWGATDAEVAARTPADDLVARPRARWVRAASSRAAPDRVWRWVCQLTVAPYSYDLVDNLGRRSPRALTPGADDVRVGQRLLVLFVVDSVTTGEQLTLRRRRPGRGPVGEFAITYRVLPVAGGSRLVATVVVDGSPGRAPTVLRWLLGWGDLVMMRRQLRTLARLAES
jgi:hypothetical protein